jgi:hypothetical protein
MPEPVGPKVLLALAELERQAGDAAPELKVYHHRDWRAEVQRQAGELHGQNLMPNVGDERTAKAPPTDE